MNVIYISNVDLYYINTFVGLSVSKVVVALEWQEMAI